MSLKKETVQLPGLVIAFSNTLKGGTFIDIMYNVMSEELKIKRVRKKRGRIITVFGKRWFDRVNGNTYFSVSVYVDGEFKGRQPYEYGYGDQYLQRALTILEGVGCYPKVEHEALWHLAQLHGDKFNYFVADVHTKKEL